MFYPGVDADCEGGHQEGGDRGQERHHRPEVQEDYSQEKLMGNQSAVEYQKKESLTRSFSSFPLSVLILENGYMSLEECFSSDLWERIVFYIDDFIL